MFRAPALSRPRPTSARRRGGPDLDALPRLRHRLFRRYQGVLRCFEVERETLAHEVPLPDRRRLQIVARRCRRRTNLFHVQQDPLQRRLHRTELPLGGRHGLAVRHAGLEPPPSVLVLRLPQLDSHAHEFFLRFPPGERSPLFCILPLPDAATAMP